VVRRSWTEAVQDPPGDPYDRARATRTLNTDEKDRVELRRMAFLTYLDEDFERTGTRLKRFVNAHPESPEGHAPTSGLLTRLGQYQEAATSYAKALEFAPESPAAVSGMALVRAHLGEHEASGARFAELEELTARGPLIDARRGALDAALGQNQAALEGLERALRTRESLDAAGRQQLRLEVLEGTLFETLRSDPEYDRLMTRFYGRSGYTPPARESGVTSP